MGINFIDEYTLSHFIAGILMQRLDLSRTISYSLAVFFEIFENYFWVPYGGRCIHIKYILPIIDCKKKPDSITNIIGDIIFFIVGYEYAKIISIQSIPMLPKYFRIFIPIMPLLLSLITTNIIGETPDYEVH